MKAEEEFGGKRKNMNNRKVEKEMKEEKTKMKSKVRKKLERQK
jgi:hypothetical protein